MKLEIKELHASVEGKEILKGVNLSVSQGETHALMGPNGSGKSTLAYTVMGHPKYQVTSGEILIDGESVVGLPPDKRVKKGLFLAFQYPVSVQGVSMFSFLRAAYNNSRPAGSEPPTIFEFKEVVAEKLKLLNMDESFLNRYLNEGFSGGEKKKAEILQMALMQPKFAVLDETDSGLDIDALRVVAEGINKVSGPQTGSLLITHYQRILKYVKPQFVHVMFEGRIIESGGEELSRLLEEKGYTWIRGYREEEQAPPQVGQTL
ncbi:MAG: Fe-S cluster assembly ATPase SufC [Nitrososphaerota archaeon]|jgi:Fe-S cluster assembly ATP-binding protein|nr:Fe-S cluster assembly ATPase SufC [Nitrososphaerota archaeon]MDG6917853.1 Fe-S cluster assembly ATPase SufC [Nitrososphaerota archaeon]MDG6946376.1 Fe-S cluster assembly ATPase SufC [Nitrososphaerota archaeon]MDG6947858.1 Fe-S cluster assembly ATPase SufC [Nitrososphaerota archaeon]